MKLLTKAAVLLISCVFFSVILPIALSVAQKNLFNVGWGILFFFFAACLFLLLTSGKKETPTEVTENETYIVKESAHG